MSKLRSAAVVLVFASACGEVAPTTSYHRDVRPIIEGTCQQCHVAGSIAPFTLTSYEEVYDYRALIQYAVTSRIMPPWPADSSCRDYKGDLSLSDGEIAAISAWVDDGGPEGDPSEFVAKPPAPDEFGLDLLSGPSDFVARSRDPFTPTLSSGDNFRCFVFNPGLTQDRYMTGIETQVDNESVLHHLILSAVPATEAAALAVLEDLDPEPGYDCFGGVGVSDAEIVGGWVPGNAKMPYPPGTGLLLEAGSLMVTQMHYSPSVGGGGADQSGVAVWLLPPGQMPAEVGGMTFAGNMPFEIPAQTNGMSSTACDVVWSESGTNVTQATGHTFAQAQNDPGLIGRQGCVQQDMYFKVDTPNPLKLWSVVPHMHLKGQHITVEIYPFTDTATPSIQAAECLADVPRWDFNWQRFYWLKEPIELPQNTLLRLTCRYDTRGSSAVVGLGEESTDEMCVAGFYLSTPP